MKLPSGPQLPSLLQTLQITAQPIRFLETCAQRYGDTFTLRVLGPKSPPVVFFSHPQAIQSIFTTQAGKLELGKVTHVFRPLTGEQSLIMQDGQRHQRQRQLLMPALHGERLHTYGKLICAIAREAIQEWKPNASLSMQEPMLEISLEIILRVVFGLNPGWRYQQLKELIGNMLESVTSDLYSTQFFFPPLQQDLGTWSPWGKFVRQQQQIRTLIYAEINERRAQPNPDARDILSMLMSARDDAGEIMTDVELVDQLITLLLLGHETTASGLNWAFYWVHRHPQVLDKLLKELDTLGSNADPVAITQLPYLTAVCKEALRVYPIALISQPRLVKESVQLEGYEFEPGAILVPCIYLAHRRPEVYPEPDQFRPERFLNQKFSPYEYLPFGGGTRSCIGMALSMFEMKLVLATVVSRYQLAIAHNRPARAVRRGITFVPSSDFKLTVIGERSRAIASKPLGAR